MRPELYQAHQPERTHVLAVCTRTQTTGPLERRAGNNGWRRHALSVG